MSSHGFELKTLTGGGRDVSTLSGLFTASATGKRRRKRKGSPLFGIRLSADERSRLEALAGDTPLATYIKFRLFNGVGPVLQRTRLRRRPAPDADTQLIAKLLGALAEARLANNLNQLAKAANMGTLEISRETERELVEACADIRAMRRDLMAALGLKA